MLYNRVNYFSASPMLYNRWPQDSSWIRIQRGVRPGQYLRVCLARGSPSLPAEVISTVIKPFLYIGLLIPDESGTLLTLQQRPTGPTLVDGAAMRSCYGGGMRITQKILYKHLRHRTLAGPKAVQRGLVGHIRHFNHALPPIPTGCELCKEIVFECVKLIALFLEA